LPTKPTGRPRGRPKGSKNIPSVEAFVAESLSAPPPVKRKRGGNPNPPRSIWKDMTPEERTAYSAKIRAKIVQDRTGVPRGMSIKDFNAAKAAQQPIIERIMKKMADNGQLPDDPMAVEALKEAMTVLRSPIPPKEKIAAARLVLDFTKPKPTTKVEHTVRTAEDFLDEMAED